MNLLLPARLCLATLALISFSSQSMTVADFLQYKTMQQSAADPHSPLHKEERQTIHNLETQMNQNLAGLAEGAMSMSDLGTLWGNKKMICAPSGLPIAVSKLSDDLSSFYYGLDVTQQKSIKQQRIGLFVSAFLMKKYPCNQ